MNVFVTDLGLGDLRFYSNGHEGHKLETCDAVLPGKASSRFSGSAIPSMAARSSETSIICGSTARCHSPTESSLDAVSGSLGQMCPRHIVRIVTPCSLVSGYQHLDRCARVTTQSPSV